MGKGLTRIPLRQFHICHIAEVSLFLWKGNILLGIKSYHTEGELALRQERKGKYYPIDKLIALEAAKKDMNLQTEL